MYRTLRDGSASKLWLSRLDLSTSHLVTHRIHVKHILCDIPLRNTLNEFMLANTNLFLVLNLRVLGAFE